MITLSSDFGTPYPAAMKGVILDRTDAQLVDVAHDFPRQDVRTTAFWLREVLPYFPPAVHLVVVDPGVGTDRNALVLRVAGHALVGPDNGVLVPAARRIAMATEGAKPCSGKTELTTFVIDDADAASSTFHGRDVFAPAAASIHEVGIDRLESLEMIEPVDDYVRLDFPDPEIDVEAGSVTGEVLVVDDFGNAITNAPGTILTEHESVLVNGLPTPVGETFGSVEEGERLATVGSHGYVELDVNRGRGDVAFDIGPGDEVVLEINGDGLDS